MDAAFLNSLEDEDLRATCGVGWELFETIWIAFCPGLRSLKTRFVPRHALQAYMFTVSRQGASVSLTILLQDASNGSPFPDLARRAQPPQSLAMDSSRNQASCRGHGPHHTRQLDCARFGPLPAQDFYGPDVMSIVDTYPVRVRRPKGRAWRRALYQGKYKSFIVKV